MNIACLPVEKAVHRALLRKPLAREAFDLFREGLKRLFDRIDQGESEEHLKRIVADFLTEVWYRDVGEINTKDRADLVIHAGRSSRDPVAVIIETKHPANAAEMISAARLNATALHAAAVLRPQRLHRTTKKDDAGCPKCGRVMKTCDELK